ncbi:MAG: imidazole glycerol phosphate synthase subunit HisH [Firmicutes bacterium]|nr:imidazole glycerol phosphate synthase subunit HisH [Bacillota bacterium]
MIAVIDYGVGNLFSLSSSLAYLGLDNMVTSRAEDLQAADRLILPGVGAFGDAAAKLRESGLFEVVKQQAAAGKPLLGICLGMQLLFEKSTEYGEHEGLGLIPGTVEALRPDLADQSLKVPHIGWNSLQIIKDDPLFRYIQPGDYVYYVHSFYAKNCAANTLAVSDYSIPVTGVVRAASVYGTQFHPEKSGEVGLNLLKAFAEL